MTGDGRAKSQHFAPRLSADGFVVKMAAQRLRQTLGDPDHVGFAALEAIDRERKIQGS